MTLDGESVGDRGSEIEVGDVTAGGKWRGQKEGGEGKVEAPRLGWARGPLGSGENVHSSANDIVAREAMNRPAASGK